MAHDDDTPEQNPNERFREDIQRLQENMAAAAGEFAQVQVELSEFMARVFPKFVSSIKKVKTFYEEYAAIQPQLVIDWDVLSEKQREGTIEFDAFLSTLYEKFDSTFLRLAQLREIALSLGPELSADQSAFDEAATSVRDDLRRIHEI